MNDTSPSYVKRSCAHCGCHIEFDESVLSPGDVLTILCPRCQAELTISRPDPFAATAEKVLSQFIGTCGPSERVDFVTLATKGAARNDPISMQLLGFAYYVGFALKADRAKAAQYLYRAAAAGNADAQFNLGLMYHLGSAVEKDPLQAFAWWLKAAEEGHVPAQNNVGYLYDTGEVVQRDYVEAFKWMSLAAFGGFEGAEKHCDELAAKMTSEQREESYQRVQDFQSNLAEKPTPSPSWWNQKMAERQEQEDRHLAAMELASREPIYERRPIPSEVRLQVWIRDEGRCMKCGSRERLHLDHIIPVSKGGSDALENLELLCQPCNLSKGARIQ